MAVASRSFRESDIKLSDAYALFRLRRSGPGVKGVGSEGIAACKRVVRFQSQRRLPGLLPEGRGRVGSAAPMLDIFHQVHLSNEEAGLSVDVDPSKSQASR